MSWCRRKFAKTTVLLLLVTFYHLLLFWTGSVALSQQRRKVGKLEVRS